MRMRGKRWWLALLGWCAAGVFATLWAIELVPFATVWGDVGSWVTAVFTLGGLIYAGLGLRHQADQRRREEELRIQQAIDLQWAQARQVAITSRLVKVPGVQVSTGAWVTHVTEDSLRVEYELVNTSPYPIDAVVVLSPLFEDSREGEECGDEEIVQGTLFPGERVKGEGHVTTSKVPFSGMVDVCRVMFTDSWGTHWLRGPGTLEQREMPALTC